MPNPEVVKNQSLAPSGSVSRDRSWMGRVFGQRSNPWQPAADALHDDLVAAVRRPAFYLSMGVPDTFEGRFELLVLHVGLLLRRLRMFGQDGRDLAQALVDTLFGRFDVALRELGVSDVAVPKRMKRLAEAYKGRLAAYDRALDAKDASALEAALTRNVLDGKGSASALARYILRAEGELSGFELKGRETSPALHFPDPACIAP